MAGFALGEWLGPVTLDSARSRLARKRDEDEAGPRLKTAETAGAARLALERDSELRGLGARSPSPCARVWSSSTDGCPAGPARSRRARRGCDRGIDTLVNCILVRGEDDAPAPSWT